MLNDEVVLVDENDAPTGTMEKLEAHRRGLLHRAFSVFVLDGGGRVLMQQRALSKYHSGGLWTNSCCSHPRPGEAVQAAAERRLQEELGVRSPLVHRFHFTYRADVGNGLVEHEFDHVFLGRHDGDVHFSPAEVMAVRWMPPAAISTELAAAPERFTAWFRICWPQVSGLIANGIVAP